MNKKKVHYLMLKKKIKMFICYNPFIRIDPLPYFSNIQDVAKKLEILQEP